MLPQHTCSQCASTERYYAKGLCKPCYNRAHRAAHPEKYNAYEHAAYAKHREKKLAYKRVHYAAHRAEKLRYQAVYGATHGEEIARYRRQWKKHRKDYLQAYFRVYDRTRPAEKKREHVHRRRARVRTAFVSAVDLGAIWRRDGGRCGICGKPVKRSEASPDHILPLAAGGTHEPRNVRLTHRLCNIRRKHLGAGQLRLLG